MRKYAKVIIEKEEIREIYCNVCGKTMHKDQYGYIEDHIHIDKQWGYFSELDGQNHEIDICSYCYVELIKSFKISPNKKN